MIYSYPAPVYLRRIGGGAISFFLFVLVQLRTNTTAATERWCQSIDMIGLKPKNVEPSLDAFILNKHQQKRMYHYLGDNFFSSRRTQHMKDVPHTRVSHDPVPKRRILPMPATGKTQNYYLKYYKYE